MDTTPWAAGTATGVGSMPGNDPAEPMPGNDPAEVVEVVLGELPDLRTCPSCRPIPEIVVTFHPDGTMLATGGFGDGAVRVWDPGTGQTLRPVPASAQALEGSSRVDHSLPPAAAAARRFSSAFGS